MFRSTINIAAVTHTVDTNDANLVSNLVNHAVITHSDAPVAFAASQFAATRRTWVRRECSNCHDHAIVNLGRQTGEIFLGGAFKQDAIPPYLRLRSAR